MIKNARLIFTYIFSFFILNSFSQSNIVQGKVYSRMLKKNVVPYKYLGADKENCYFLTKNPKHLHVEKYNVINLNKVYDVNITLPKKRDVKFIEALYVNNKTLVFRQDYSFKRKEITLFLQLINEHGEKDSDLKEVFKSNIPKKSYYIDSEGELWSDLTYYFFSLSEDKKTLAVFNEEYYWDGKDVKLKAIHIKFINTKTLKVILEKDIPIVYQTTKINPWNYKIDNDLNVYFCFNYVNNENKYQYAIGVLGNNSQSVVAMDLDVNLKIHEYFDLDFKINRNILFCSFLYRNATQYDPYKPRNITQEMGLHTSAFDLSNFKKIKSDSSHFDKDVIKSIFQGKMNMVNVFIISGIEVVGDEYYTFISETKSMNWIKGPIVIYKNKQDFSIEWQKVIFRDFATVKTNYKDDFMFVINSNKELKVIYGEYPGFVDKFKDDEPNINNTKYAKARKTDLVCATINTSGKIIKETLIPDGKFSPRFHTSVGNKSDKIIIPAEDNKYIMFFYEDKNYRLVKFNINK